MSRYIPTVAYQMHDNERSTRLDYKPMRVVGFAPWNGVPCIDGPTHDDETFAQQAERLRTVMALPDGPLDVEDM